MDHSKLSYSEIVEIAGKLDKSSKEMETLLNEIKGLFNKVGTDDVWNGTAAQASKEEFDELSAKFPEFSQAVNECYKYLLQVVESYKTVDQAVMGK